MFKEKKSFFKKMATLVNPPQQYDEDTDSNECEIDEQPLHRDDAVGEAQLTIDMCQTSKDIVIQTMVAGVKPEDLDISINREMITIRGVRTNAEEQSTNDYFHEELYWGAFSRTILLPQEIDVDETRASIQNGLLTIRLPKVDKHRVHRLEIEEEE